MNKTVTPFLFGILVIGFFSACSSGNGDNKNEIDKDILDPNKSLNANFDGKIFSIPSPMQTALLLEEVNAPFKESYLNRVTKVGSYSTEIQKALNLGIYGTDLGYLAIYKQNSLALKYLSTVEKLTGNLGLEGAFDKAFMKRFENNSTNKDSMMVIVSDAFKKSDSFLKSNDRKTTSALILVGGWIESMYLACEINAEKKNDKIVQRIGEQQITLATIIEILTKYNKDKALNELIDQMTSLKKDFDHIQIQYEFVKPKTDASKNLTTLQHKTTVIATPETILAITEKIRSIRLKITA
jgi:hypothetical protein